MLALSVFGQPGNVAMVASTGGIDRMSVVKNSIEIDEWHEKSYWPLYEKFMDKVQNISLLIYRSLDDVAKIDKTTNDQEAFEHAKKLIDYQNAKLVVWEQYFSEIGKEFNGLVALQFIQTEIMLDMMECSRIYDDKGWKKFRFHPKVLTSDEYKAAKYNIMTKALSLTAEETAPFYILYSRYEAECEDLFGEDYNVFSLYAGEATDYTPAIAKRLGRDCISLLKRETKLKEKYFMEINDVLSPSLAARFLAWEDYYSLISKMHMWAD